MNRIMLIAVVVVLGCLSTAVGHATESAADEAMIRKAVESYVAAFNRGDAEAVAAHWCEDGQIVTPAGEKFQGRATIQ